MRKSLKYKILVSVLAFSILGTGNIVFSANTGIITSSTQKIGNSYFYIGSNEHSDNKVTIDTSTAYGIAAGFDKDGSNGAADNFVNIIGTETAKIVVDGFVYGGYSKNGKVSNNIINISNSDITESVYGGFSANETAHDNFVTINDGSLMNVYGGYSSSSGDVICNHVIIIGNTVVKGTVDGGNAYNGNADSNEVNISGGNIDGNIRGGIGNNASNNTVSINMENIKGNIYGGYGYI